MNTAEEKQELEDARQNVSSGVLRHIYDWVFACGHIRFETGKCDECVRRYRILVRDNKERRLERMAEILRENGYIVQRGSS